VISVAGVARSFTWQADVFIAAGVARRVLPTDCGLTSVQEGALC
jgi:hypothetical protein